MTTQQYFSKYNGKPIDFDGKFGDQCVDNVMQYSQDVLRIAPWGTGNAVGRWTTYPKDKFDRFEAGSGVPKQGDIMIWSKDIGSKFGHIAIFVEGTTNAFTSFDQNYLPGTKCHYQKHTGRALLGWLRFKQPSDLTMKERERLNQLEGFVSRMQAGCMNEYLLPSGTVVQVVNYTQYGDYHDIMGRQDKYLIHAPEDLARKIWQFRTGGFDPTV